MYKSLMHRNKTLNINLIINLSVHILKHVIQGFYALVLNIDFFYHSNIKVQVPKLHVQPNLAYGTTL